MNRQYSLFLTGLAVFSGLTSFMFVYYGVSILTSEFATEWAKVFAYVSVGYGLGNIYILSSAWRGSGTWPAWAGKLIAICFFGVFLMDKWKTGLEGDLEYLGILIVAGVLWLNWFAVKKLSRAG
jgi:hypothetical protein